jgi:tetratricopeptide (TPR) repeat protein
VKDFDQALSLAGSKITEDEIDICYYKAASQYLGGKTKDALKTYSNLIRYDKKNGDAYYLRGALYFKTGETRKAMTDFKDAVATNQKDYDRYFHIYNILNNAGQTEEAGKFLNLLLDTDTKSGEAYQAKGKALEIRKDYDNALKDYDLAVGKGLEEARLDMARIYALNKETKKAEKELSTYQKNTKPSGKSYNTIGEFQFNQGNYKDALKSFQKGLELKDVSNKQELLKNEIAALERTGDFAKAKKNCQSYIEEYPYDQEMQDEYLFLKTR